MEKIRTDLFEPNEYAKKFLMLPEKFTPTEGHDILLVNQIPINLDTLTSSVYETCVKYYNILNVDPIIDYSINSTTTAKGLFSERQNRKQTFSIQQAISDLTCNLSHCLNSDEDISGYTFFTDSDAGINYDKLYYTQYTNYEFISTQTIDGFNELSVENATIHRYQEQVTFTYSNLYRVEVDLVNINSTACVKFKDDSYYELPKYYANLLYSDDYVILSAHQTKYALIDLSTGDQYSINYTDIDNLEINDIAKKNMLPGFVSRSDDVLTVLQTGTEITHNDDLDADFYILKLYRVDISDYTQSNFSANSTEITINWGDFPYNTYFTTESTSVYFYHHYFELNNLNYLTLMIINNTTSDFITFKINDDDTCDFISHDYFSTRNSNMTFLPVYSKPTEFACVISTQYLDAFVTKFLTFDGTSWDVNRVVHSKSFILRRDEYLYYVNNNFELVIEKYITRPKINIRYEKSKYVYASNDYKTKVYISSIYYLPNFVARIKATIKTDNAYFDTCSDFNHKCKEVYVEIQNGEYPLDLWITGYYDLQIDLELVGLWDLTDNIIRDFTRSTTIEFTHSIERVFD